MSTIFSEEACSQIVTFMLVDDIVKKAKFFLIWDRIKYDRTDMHLIFM